MRELKQLCCPGLVIVFIFACLTGIAWGICVVAALDREERE